MKKYILANYLILSLLLHFVVKAQSEPSKWSIHISPLLNQKGKCVPDSPSTRIFNTYNALSLQFGINRYWYFRNQSYLNIGLQHGWINEKYAPRNYYVSGYPTLDYNEMKMKSPFEYPYNAFSMSYHLLLERSGRHLLYVGIGAALRWSTESSMGEAGYSYIDAAGKEIYLFNLDTWYPGNAVHPDLLLSISDKILIHRKQRLLVELNGCYSFSSRIVGTYDYFPYSNNSTSGTYSVSGSYIALTLGYLFNFKRDQDTE